MKHTKSSKTLHNTKQVAEVRRLLLEQQNGLCRLTGLPIDPKQDVLDHDHDSQFVRAVLHRQANAILGKIENLETRYLSWWYPYDLATFLRQTADYLDENHSQEYVHPGWIKKVKTRFNSLRESTKDKVLMELLGETGKNGLARKKLFSKYISKYKPEYGIIDLILTKHKDSET